MLSRLTLKLEAWLCRYATPHAIYNLDRKDLSHQDCLFFKSFRGFCDLNGDGVFRVKEVRTILDDIFLLFAVDATRWVKYIPIKINVFAWRARLDRLPTRSNLVRRGVVLDSSLCPLCGLVPEDIYHVLFRCDTTKLVFRRICRWIKLILEGVFYVAWWHLWVYRSQSIFAPTPPRRSGIFDDIVSRSFTCKTYDFAYLESEEQSDWDDDERSGGKTLAI
nr:RNA-directed DNA polymerase, eukaryota [Tanacetum cinerariifolium]